MSKRLAEESGGPQSDFDEWLNSHLIINAALSRNESRDSEVSNQREKKTFNIDYVALKKEPYSYYHHSGKERHDVIYCRVRKVDGTRYTLNEIKEHFGTLKPYLFGTEFEMLKWVNQAILNHNTA